MLIISRSRAPDASGRGGGDERGRKAFEDEKFLSDPNGTEQRRDREGDVEGNKNGNRHSSDIETAHPEAALHRQNQGRSDERVKDGDIVEKEETGDPRQNLGRLN